MAHSYILLRYMVLGYSPGVLLELNKDGSYEWHKHRHRFYRGDRPSTIRCDNDGDVAPLSEVECYLLDGILANASRYEVYSTPGKLEWGRSLKVGDTVLARLPVPNLITWHGSSISRHQHQHQYMNAIIRWCGSIGNRGYMFGVEIMVSSYVYIVFNSTHQTKGPTKIAQHGSLTIMYPLSLSIQRGKGLVRLRIQTFYHEINT